MENNEEQNKKDSEEQQQDEPPLFRQEALEHKKGSFLGKTLIVAPVSFYVWTIGLFLIAVAIGLFVYFGTYSKHYKAHGILIPNKGLIHIYAKSQGIVEKKYVEQGEQVKEGQLLYLISTEQHTLSEQGTVAQQIELLEKQIEVQKNRLEIAKNNMERFKKLLDERVIPEVDYQKQYDAYLSLESSINELEQKLSQAKSSGDYTIRAPGDGTISALIAMVGDRVSQERPLASIIPKGAYLQAMLYVQAESIGFVEPGQKVLLKYAAYPYQNFGLYEGTVDSIDKSVLFPKDIELPAGAQQPGVNMPIYRVIVNLKQQTVNVYGKPYPLTSGIMLQADLLGDKRNIWQFIFEPLYSLKGSLASS